MRKLARGSDSGGIASVSVTPRHGRRRVVCPVDVVVVDGSASQVGGLSSRGRWSSSLDTAAAGTGRGPGEVGINGDSDHWNLGGGGWRDLDVDGLVGSNGLDGGDFLDDGVVDNVSLGDNFDLGQGRGDGGAGDQQECGLHLDDLHGSDVAGKKQDLSSSCFDLLVQLIVRGSEP